MNYPYIGIFENGEAFIALADGFKDDAIFGVHITGRITDGFKKGHIIKRIPLSRKETIEGLGSSIQEFATKKLMEMLGNIH